MTAVDPRIAILSRLNDPPYNERAERHCTPWDDAEKLLDAYRGAVIREAANALAAKQQGDAMTDTAQQENESVNDADWRVPLKYTRQDLAALLASTEAGQYARMSIADYPSGGDAYVIVQGRGQSIRFNRLRVVDDPQYARDLAAVLLAWAEREDAE